MLIESLNVRVVNVIEQRDDLEHSVLKKIFLVTGSKGRCPNESLNVRVVDVIEQRNDSECSILKERRVYYRKYR